MLHARLIWESGKLFFILYENMVDDFVCVCYNAKTKRLQ